jgi:hypothetical protein
MAVIEYLVWVARVARLIWLNLECALVNPAVAAAVCEQPAISEPHGGARECIARGADEQPLHPCARIPAQ